MSFTKPRYKSVDPPRFESCEKCPAPALVAIEMPMPQSLDGRFVFCGHHFDLLNPEVKVRAISINDTRKIR